MGRRTGERPVGGKSKYVNAAGPMSNGDCFDEGLTKGLGDSNLVTVGALNLAVADRRLTGGRF